MSFQTLRLFIYIAFIIGIVMATPPAFAEFVPKEVEVCPAWVGVRDPEFDPNSQLMTFFDGYNRLRITRVARTGEILPRGCRGNIIDTDTTLSVPNFPLKNGPEWGLSQRGTEIFYTKINESGEPALARAWYDDGWLYELLDEGDNRGLALASTDLTDSAPRLLYVNSLPDDTYTSMWRVADDPASETIFPANVVATTGSSPRWIAGQHAISTSVPDENGVCQAARYDLDTRQIEILTDDPGDKSEIWMWSAPEFGGEPVFIAVVDGCCLRVYRQIEGVWTVIQTFDPSTFSSRPAILSPEPLVYNGRSYLVMQLAARRYAPGEIWIASIDPETPLLVQVSDPEQPNLVRTEPEWMTTPGGVFVYYTLREAGGRFSLRRLDIPLGPKLQ